jgi:hypothetical protein
VNRVELFLSQIPNGEAAFLEAQRRAFSYLYEQALAGSGKQFFLDKTPRYYHVIPELYRLFPDARYIFLIRNPLAVFASILQSWVGNDWTKLQWYREDLFDAPTLLMNGLKIPGIQSILLHYEDIIANPEETIRCLCDQLNLPFYQPMIDYGQQKFSEADWGDQGSIYRRTRPHVANKDQWAEILNQSYRWQSWAFSYLRTLGPGLLGEMGYVYDEIEHKLGPRIKKHNPKERPLPLAAKDISSYSFFDRLYWAILTARNKLLLSLQLIKKTTVNRLKRR